ncbi:MAG: hypothetical protein B7Z44_14145 [Caulobacter sp. 12-67-6]|nr:MAG: hypothetical protein B7Z44_14145 [Caulobacter sp. 12-67-6]OYX69673.1 MAG: hypothetical protein B7Y81_13700 [Caulobacter sp. 32-67-35]OZA79896.1 MAG: hypothetical protein B7X77_02480 [Caulobacter sp. 39-67-4]HQR91076.1 hypothetical protein [Caulobacter sp.]
MRAKPPDPRAQAKRAALNALKRARRAADKSGIALSDWEGEFLNSVTQRVETYGRAFGDPEKGGRDQALSGNQAIKLKEIVAKAKGEKKPMKRGRGFGRRAEPQSTTSTEGDE